MANPLLTLATRLERIAAERRARRARELVQSDPHLARDIGLPYRPREPRRVEPW